MKLILAAVVVTFVTASPAVWNSGLSTLCVEECTPPEIAMISLISTPCPIGKVCVSSGCGHVCTSLTELGKRSECPMLKCIPCPAGYEVDQDGCQTCRCKPEEEKRQVCSGIMCMMFCFNGFAKDANGCDICRCADGPIV
ncbi:hypothetical protein Btru_058276 [Bulinus truncatus]|nr:hypothetical protein Btru_058276 [Bulinus truncatus]